MRIAFYAPMKAPTHTVPSGDRHIARLLWRALELKDHELELASDLRSWEGAGDFSHQQTIKAQAILETDAYLQRARNTHRPDVWFTYHAYHKAPDWIGPCISRALNIPYVVAEASYAAKQSHGPWAEGLEHTRLSLNLASAIINLNNNDAAGMEQIVSDHRRVHTIKPFVDIEEIKSALVATTSKSTIARRYGLKPDTLWLMTVGMMRPGDKLASFKFLANALKHVDHSDFHLIIIGDGKSRAEVEHIFKSNNSVRFLGQLRHAALFSLFTVSDLFVWPAVNEAYGIAMLEAQACGLPVVAGRYGGVDNIVDDGLTGILTPPDDRLAFANAITHLIDNSEKRKAMGMAARNNVRENHGIEKATEQLDHILHSLI